MRKYSLLLAGLVLLHASATAPKSARTASRDLAELKRRPPPMGMRTGLVQVYYQASRSMEPTRIFAYLGRPAEGRGAFSRNRPRSRRWRKALQMGEHWASRGYVALAMDTAGCGPNGPQPDGGPAQDDAASFTTSPT
jgi:hypothetical protein